MYTEKDLVEFGNFILSGRQDVSVPEAIVGKVTDPELSRWKEERSLLGESPAGNMTLDAVKRHNADLIRAQMNIITELCEDASKLGLRPYVQIFTDSENQVNTNVEVTETIKF